MSHPVPAAGTRNKVGTSHPIASICSLWAERLAYVGLQSLVKLFVVVSRWLSIQLESLPILLRERRRTVGTDPQKSVNSMLGFFDINLFYSLSNSPPVEADFGHCCLLQNEKNLKLSVSGWLHGSFKLIRLIKIKNTPRSSVTIPSAYSSVLNVGRGPFNLALGFNTRRGSTSISKGFIPRKAK